MHVGYKQMAAYFGQLTWISVGVFSIAFAAHAEEKQMPWESERPPYIDEARMRLEVSVWNANIDTIVRSDPTTTAAGTTLTGERDLGLKKKKYTPDFELTFFPGDRHILRLSGFSSERTGEVKLTQRVQFHTDLYNTGDVVKSEVGINLVGLTYGYRVLKGRWYDLAATMRMQVGTFTTNLQGPNTYTRQADTITLPLPMVGGEGRLQVYKKLNLTARYQWLGATVVDTKGVIREWQAGLLYQHRRNFGVELGYRGYSVHVESGSNDHPGLLDMRYRGLLLGFRGSL